jgi:hypothetical protein
MEEEAAAAVDTLSCNNQPTTDLEVELLEAEPCVPLCPTRILELALLPHPWQRRRQHPHRHNVHQAGSKAQPERDLQQHNEWLKR